MPVSEPAGGEAQRPPLDIFPTPSNISRIQMTSDEVTSVCPITGQPDFYTVDIDYAPAASCIESKSLKIYLQSFRTTGAFGEDLASIVLDAVCAAIEPRECTVVTVQKPRGGITIRATATMPSAARD